MLGKPRILSHPPTCLINSIKYEHSCKILYISTVALIFTDEGDSSSVPASPSVDACLTMAACGGMQQLSVTDQNSAGESERVSYYKNLS